MKKLLYSYGFIVFISIHTLGQSNIFPTPSGNVGIMVNSTPSATLHIGGGAGNLHAGNNGLLIKFNSGDRALMELHDPNGQNRTIFQSLSDATYLLSHDQKPLLLQSMGGNIGIGTENPGTLLSLGGSITNSKLAIWEGYYDGQILRTGFGISNGQFRLFLPAANNRFSFLSDEAGTSEVMTIQGEGKVGIGVSMPESQLHTNGTVRFAGLTNDNAKDRVVVGDANGNLYYRDAATLIGSSTAGWSLTGNNVSGTSFLGSTSSQDLQIITNNTPRIYIGATGDVGIGHSYTSGYKLSVEGNIRTRKVRVDQDTWADYVFENTYQLRSINELEQYIQREKHLPDVPSAAEVKKEGLDLGNNQAVLLKKIEELTLYVIEQNKKIEALQKLVLQQQSEKEAQKKERGKGSK